MKEKHAERARNIEKNTKNTQEKSLKTKELYLFQRKTYCYIGSNPSINVRLNLFTFKEVNLVLEHPRSTNFIVWTFLTYEPKIGLGSLQIESLQYIFVLKTYKKFTRHATNGVRITLMIKPIRTIHPKKQRYNLTVISIVQY